MRIRLKEVFQPPRRLRITRDGRWFVFMTILVGVAAVNTANNLLYLLLGMMLGVVILSGILSEWMLQKLEVERLPPTEIFARQEALLPYRIHNPKRFMASISIQWAEHEERQTRAERRRLLGLPPERKRRRLWGGFVEDGDPGPPKGLALRVPARGYVTANAVGSFPRRGLYRYAGIDIETRFPFGFFEKTRPVKLPGEVLVFPAPQRALQRSDEELSLFGEVVRSQEGRGEEFFGLRDFREGDDPRDIAWKVSARRENLVRRTRENEENQEIALHLYNWVPPSLSEAAAWEAREALEEAIEEAAGLASRWLRRGFRVSLTTIGERVHAGAGPGQLHTLLRHLALLRVHSDAEPPPMDVVQRRQRVLLATTETPLEVVARFDRVIESGALQTAPRRAA